MSLVNDMLRDLEQRGQKTASGALMDASVQPVQQEIAELPPHRAPWPWIVMVIALVVGFAALAWQQWQGIQTAADTGVVAAAKPTPVSTPKLAQPPTPTAEPEPSAKHTPVQPEIGVRVERAEPDVTPSNLGADQQQPAGETQDPATTLSARRAEAEAVAIMPRLQQIGWKNTERGGELTLAFSAPITLNILQQSADAIRLALPDTVLEDTVPLLPVGVIRSFELNTAAQQLMLSLSTVRAAQFELRRDTQQVQLAINLSEPVDPVPAVTPDVSSDRAVAQLAKPTQSDAKPQKTAPIPEKPALETVKQSSVQQTVAKPETATASAPEKAVPKAEAKAVSNPVPKPQAQSRPALKPTDKVAHSVAQPKPAPALKPKPVAVTERPSKPVSKQEKPRVEPSVKREKTTQVAKPEPVSEGPATPRKAKVASAANTKPVTSKYSDKQAAAQARVLLQNNQVGAAQRLLTTQLEAAPGHRESRVLLASLQLAAGKLNAADDLVDEGLKLLPADSGLKKVKARVLLAQEKPDAAVQLLGSAQPGVQADPEYHELWAVALQQNKQADDAIRVYYQLLQRDSQQARWWVGLGYSLELAARIDESRKAYKSSLQIPDLDANLKHFVTQRLKQLAQR